jgi:hypothetical protein
MAASQLHDPSMRIEELQNLLWCKEQELQQFKLMEISKLQQLSPGDHEQTGC